MRIYWAVGGAVLACASVATAQIGRTFDWHTAGGDAQRSNWEKSDTKFTKDGVKDFRLILKHKLEGAHKGSGYLTPPIVLGTLISYRGFKELAFVANEAGDVWALDVDLDKVFWQRHVDLPKSKAKPGCPAGVTSQPTMEPGAVFGARRRRTSTGTGAAPSQESVFRKIFAPRTVFLLGSDGKLYRLDTSTGKDMNPPVPMLPAGANASNLNAAEGEIYTTAANNCGGAPNGVWAADLSGEQPKVASFTSQDGIVGRGGAVLGDDGQVYVQTAASLQALSAKELKPEQAFSAAFAETSPVVFTHKDRELVVTAAKDSSLYLLDSKSLATPLYQTPPVAADAGHGLWGGLSTWESAEGTRWVLAAVLGAVHGDLKAPQANGGAPNGSIVAFKLTETEGKLSLTPAWISHDLSTPQAPVIANGVVFALSAGEYRHKGKPSGHATLYGLDGETGKEIYSTGDEATAPANLSGLTMANGRVFFTTTDSTLYGFGYHLEH